MNEKKKLVSASCQWLKLSFSKGDHRLMWILPKKHIPLAVTRNRLKRWGRMAFKKLSFLEKNTKKREFLKGEWLIFALKEKKDFYKNLRKKDFDLIFKTVFETLSLKISSQRQTQKSRQFSRKAYEKT